MNPIQTPAGEFMGPGLGGMWAGQQQQQAFNESAVNQQKGLEDIYTSQQNRDIASQKLPLELERMRGENSLFPGKKEELELKNKGTKSTLDRDAYNNYSNDVIAWHAANPQASPLEIGAYSQQSAKRYGLDPNDERVGMVAGITQKGPQAVQQWKEVLTKMDPKYIEERKKAAEHLERTNVEVQGRKDVANIQGQAARDVATIGADSREAVAALKAQATSKMATIDQELVRLNALYTEAQKRGDKETAAALSAQAQRLVNAKAQIAQAVIQGKGEQLQALLSGSANIVGAPTEAFSGTTQATPKLQGAAAEDWITRAMKANPGMTRDQVIEQGKKSGKL